MTKQELLAELVKDLARAEAGLARAIERGNVKDIEGWAHDLGLAKGCLMTLER